MFDIVFNKKREKHMEKKKTFLQELKKGKSFLFIGLFLITMSLFIFYSFSIEYLEKRNEIHDIKEVKVSDVYTKIDVQVMTDYFATNDYSGIEHKTYFVWDQENIYMVDLNEKTRADLDSIYKYSNSEEETTEKPVPVLIKGMSKKIPDDLKEVAIASINKIVGREVVDTKNFYQMFGVVYLDTFATPFSTILSDLLLCLPLLIAGILFLTMYGTRKHKTKKCMQRLGKKWKDVQQELEDSSTLTFKPFHLYLTQHFLLCTRNGLEVYPYKEIVWVYYTSRSMNNFSTLKNIYIMTKDKKTHPILSITIVKNSKNTFDEIYEEILKRTPGSLEGYTKENKEKIQEM